jgi:lysyl-tRNA synthetase class 2
MTTEPPAPDWAPTASPTALRQRADLLRDIRSFFEERGALEVETPVLSRAGNSDPGMEQFGTRDDHWLRTSPEYALKRLLAAGGDDLYELGRVFRAGESGPWHNPEFTLLEWYRRGWPYPRLMDEVVDLVGHCSQRFGRQWKVQQVTYRDWLKDSAGIDPLQDTAATMASTLERAGVAYPDLRELDRDGCLDLAVTHLAQPALAQDTLTLVSLYPASQAALARLHPEDPRVAERFEAFLGGVELANGYEELTDAAEQRTRFEAENEKRRAEGRPVVPLDHHLLRALESGLPACSGVALGVDRLLMVLGGYDHLQDVLAFPAARS